MSRLPSQAVADIQASLKAITEAQAKAQGVTAQDHARLQAASAAFDAYLAGMQLEPGQTLPSETPETVGTVTCEAGVADVIPSL